MSKRRETEIEKRKKEEEYERIGKEITELVEKILDTIEEHNREKNGHEGMTERYSATACQACIEAAMRTIISIIPRNSVTKMIRKIAIDIGKDVEEEYRWFLENGDENAREEE
jgi:hypothetical protein